MDETLELVCEALEELGHSFSSANDTKTIMVERSTR